MCPSNAVPAAFLAAMIAAASSSGAMADTLDQSDLMLDSGLALAVISGNLSNTQVFTVGLEGQLSRVDVWFAMGWGRSAAIRSSRSARRPSSQVPVRVVPM